MRDVKTHGHPAWEMKEMTHKRRAGDPVFTRREMHAKNGLSVQKQNCQFQYNIKMNMCFIKFFTFRMHRRLDKLTYHLLTSAIQMFTAYCFSLCTFQSILISRHLLFVVASHSDVRKFNVPAAERPAGRNQMARTDAQRSEKKTQKPTTQK